MSESAEFATVRLLAERLGRTPLLRDWRAASCQPSPETLRRLYGGWDAFVAAAGLPPVEPPHGWSKGPGYGRRYWTEERIIGALRRIHAELGRLPHDREHTRLCKGRADWPTAETIRRFGGNGRGCWQRAFRKADVSVRIWAFASWSEEDDEFLLEKAGDLTLERIAKRLGRTPGACRRRLFDRGVRARDSRGWYTGQLLARELNIPVTRIYGAIRSGRLRAVRPPGRPYWQIDPDSVEENREWLVRAKQTHKSTPPVTTDWYTQRGLKRDSQGRIIGKREAA